MKNAKRMMLSYLAAIIFGIFSYFMLYQTVLVILYAIFNFLLFHLFIIPMYQKCQKQINNIDEFQHFASSLVMQLTITPSLMESLEAISHFFDREMQEALQDDEMTLPSKMDVLSKKYPFPIFQVMAKVLELYTNQGGDIVSMSVELLSQIDHLQVTTKEIVLDNKKKIAEILMLWLLSLGAVTYLRVILSVYYLDMVKTVFCYIVFAYLLSFTISLFMMCNTYLRAKI